MGKGEKYLFDKAIQARYEHIHFYNHWMNMYAIFNGALFVCLYTLVKECKCWDSNLFFILGNFNFSSWCYSWLVLAFFFKRFL